jgi:hypothetical protein
LFQVVWLRVRATHEHHTAQVLPLASPPPTFTQQVRSSGMRGLPRRRRRSALELRMVCSENVRRLSKSLRKGRCSGVERASESWRDGRVLITCVGLRPTTLSSSTLFSLLSLPFKFPTSLFLHGSSPLYRTPVATPSHDFSFSIWHKDTRASLEAQEEAYRTMNRLQKHAGRAAARGHSGLYTTKIFSCYCLYSRYVFKSVRLSREDFV